MVRYTNILNQAFSRDEKSKQVKSSVEEVQVTGLKKTNPSVIKNAFRDVNDAETLEELNKAIEKGIQRSYELDIVEKVDVEIDASDKVYNGAILRVKCQEKPSTRLNITTSVNTKGETAVEFSGLAASTFGRAEKLSLDVEFDAQSPSKKYSILARLTNPQLFSWCDGNLVNSIQLYTKQPLTSSISQVSHGFNSVAQVAERHQLMYDFEYRKLEKAATDEKSQELDNLIARMTDNSIRSAISHVYRYSSLDDKAAPSKGIYSRFLHSVAGFGGDTSFLKSQFDADAYYPIVKQKLTAAFHFSVGGVIPLLVPGKKDGSFERSKIFMNDHFFEAVRGYRKYVGPTDEQSGEALGGNVKLLATARLVFPLSVVSQYLYDWMGLHGHLFIDAGNVGNYDLQNKDPEYADKFVDSFLETAKISYGAGLVFLANFGRIEVNYCLPFAQAGQATPDDKQFGKFNVRWFVKM